MQCPPTVSPQFAIPAILMLLGTAGFVSDQLSSRNDDLAAFLSGADTTVAMQRQVIQNMTENLGQVANSIKGEWQGTVRIPCRHYLSFFSL